MAVKILGGLFFLMDLSQPGEEIISVLLGKGSGNVMYKSGKLVLGHGGCYSIGFF